MERFVKEYANYQKAIIKNNELMKTEIKEKAIEKIERSIMFRTNGLITVDETIRSITECFE